ncbi:cytochrome P450 [Chryseosolibacter indicus]|uniref:Cytochrome P450 n=1 Tax=Chryseosolibacter indicus TaxID=2782351 RepID=A0ABS5VZT2_9BACT|nr:cytochrome P450 [Chryseosolibacter indicus]MBT1706234.1 cytochrome P450 [Chryseosolibacter indicus]
MPAIPYVNGLKFSLGFAREGYEYIYNTCHKYQTEIFKTNVLLNDVICLTGEEATKLFYDTTKFERRKAIPKPIQKTLLGENGVQTLDAEKHKQRKAMFMSVMSPESISRFKAILSEHWRRYIIKWENTEKVVLFKEAQEILCKSACAWAGVPLPDREVRSRADDFVGMVDAFGTIGIRHWKGRAARSRTEEWITNIIQDVRQGKSTPFPGSPLSVVANANELNTHMAAVELINLTRPIVAISYYIAFIAHALYHHPECHQSLLMHDEGYLENFTHEVRRYYPFGPITGARVKEDFEWKGYPFKKGTLVFLDIYGTNRDRRVWSNPSTFNPERFKVWNKSAFNFIPQGGGGHMAGHRCAGEQITIETMKISTNYLANYIGYNVPEQDMTIDLTRIPTYPKSGFIIDHITVKDYSLNETNVTV